MASIPPPQKSPDAGRQNRSKSSRQAPQEPQLHTAWQKAASIAAPVPRFGTHPLICTAVLTEPYSPNLPTGKFGPAPFSFSPLRRRFFFSARRKEKWGPGFCATYHIHKTLRRRKTKNHPGDKPPGGFLIHYYCSAIAFASAIAFSCAEAGQSS